MSARFLALLLALILTVSLAACGNKEPSPESSAPPAAPSPESSPEETPESGDTASDIDPALTAAVEGMIAQYNDGTVTVTDDVSALPEGFVFPESLDWGKLEISLDEVMGCTRVFVPSRDGNQTAVFACYYFAPSADAGGSPSGEAECRVSYVVFE